MPARREEGACLGTPARRTAIVNIVSGWAEQDPAAATQWSESLPADNPIRLAAMRAAYSYWQLNDASAATTFANELSATERKSLVEMN